MALLKSGRTCCLREGNSDKKTNAEDGCAGPLAHNGSTTHYVTWMDRLNLERDGALLVETRQAGRVPGPLPRKGPTQATMNGGHPIPVQARVRRGRVNRRITSGEPKNIRDPTSKPLKILQWNAEGIQYKKQPLEKRLEDEEIDIALIQETHLNPNTVNQLGNRFSIRGYQVCQKRHSRKTYRRYIYPCQK